MNVYAVFNEYQEVHKPHITLLRNSNNLYLLKSKLSVKDVVKGTLR